MQCLSNIQLRVQIFNLIYLQFLHPCYFLALIYLFIYLTRYGLDGPGIESRWGQDFSYPSSQALGTHTAACTVDTN
jgi:hypothetical protein